MTAAARAADQESAGTAFLRSMAAALGAEVTPGGLLRLDGPASAEAIMDRAGAHMRALSDDGDIAFGHMHFGYCREAGALHLGGMIAVPLSPGDDDFPAGWTEM
jgi:hypothetical protein